MRVFVTGGSGFLGGRLIALLLARGDAVVALARSEAAAAKIRARGATPATGDLSDRAALEAGMRGCDVVVHAAAHVEEFGPWEVYVAANVTGVDHVLEAARAAGVKRVVHVSTEAVLAGDAPIVRADETRPRASRPAGPYPRSKGMSEELVLAANRGGLETVIVRPRFIWGAGDTSLLPKLEQAVRDGRWRWIGGGRYLTSTCHVDNVVHGILCAAERGRPGAIYFLTDGEPVVFREFVGDLVRTRGVEPGDRSLPHWLAVTLATVAELAWTWLPLRGAPPVTRTAVALAGEEVTVNDALARREIGYAPPVSIAAGLAAMR